MTPRRTTRRAAAAAVLAVGAALALAPAAPRAQTLNFGSGDSDLPIEIEADNGIEWQQDAMIFQARGNAVATRGDVRVLADVLRAYYRREPGGGTEIWRLDAEGAVHISAPGEDAYGERGVYDVDNAILVLSGGQRVRLVTETDEITADRQLEYWERKQMAVARGNALAVRADKRLRAEVLAAYFGKDHAGKTRITRVEAFDDVRVDTDKDTVVADRAVYNVNSGIATLTGSVTITRGNNRLDGCSAEVDLNTGVSKLFSCGPSAPAGRVRGVIRSNDLGAREAPAPAGE